MGGRVAGPVPSRAQKPAPDGVQDRARAASGGARSSSPGAAHGIGAATAHRPAGEGAAVVILDNDERGGHLTARELTASGARAAFVLCDVTDEPAWARAVRTAHDGFGPVDGLVSNAALMRPGPAGALSPAEWQGQLDVNLTGAFLGVRACLDDLRQQHGSVVLQSSVQALVGLPGRPGYAATKAGLTGLGRQLAVDHGPEVRVNSVLPGPVVTPAWDGLGEDDLGSPASRPPPDATDVPARWPPPSPSCCPRTPRT